MPAALNVKSYQTSKKDISNCKVTDLVLPDDIAEGEVLMEVQKFALTANNITYAALGSAPDLMYFDFFPTGEPESFGQVPVWGFATVVKSKAEGVDVGSRWYGYWPIAQKIILKPTKVGERGFVDGAVHRQKQAPIYNYYTRTASDPAYKPELEGQIAVYRPLFMTAFLLANFVAEEDFKGAKQVIISSASSKTSIGTATQLHTHSNDKVKVVGLTSAKNVEFVKSLGIYDQVVSYGDVQELNVDVPAVYIDIAGNATLRKTIHERFDARLKASVLVGLTQWESFMANAGKEEEDLPGPTPAFFFAPTQAQKVSSEMGAAGFQQAVAADWVAFLKKAAQWVKIKEHQGMESVDAIYQGFVKNQSDPQTGHIISL
eukprot:Clim_evm6s236 gene=Clim_evmTU6s236